ncbi:UDP-N-acetylglucosamine 4,6-dehydratase (inverting) [Candidatus Pelagibacter sp.]|nr:UDP-N-acetylglucosamine 4,6-dehydratase (inverting) [Candidatus Pelagibacter sp.]
MLNNKIVLLTGGTGSFGKRFVETVIKNYPKIKKLIIFSRDELKQYEMAEQIDLKKNKFIRFVIGDIRDKHRLKFAFEEVDIVIHAAALKQVPTAEYNPFEFIKTNILGAQNIIDCSLETKVEKVIALSTDKATAPINLYGATKLCSDKLFTAANNIVGKRNLKFTIVRYGNVNGSRGSIIPYFLKQKKNGLLTITDPSMTRFSISLDGGIKMVLDAIHDKLAGGEIFVPKIPSYKILDLAKAICPNCQIKYIGIRPGEKIHEQMITENDSHNTFEGKNNYVILPSHDLKKRNFYMKKKFFKPVKKGFVYDSRNNPKFLTVMQLKDIIKSFVV